MKMVLIPIRPSEPPDPELPQQEPISPRWTKSNPKLQEPLTQTKRQILPKEQQ